MPVMTAIESLAQQAEVYSSVVSQHHKTRQESNNTTRMNHINETVSMGNRRV